ncbi:hypothetical protein TrVE_jg12685 [Triparma verrucosa]|uniref:Uncharacterized protein n=1 Tax=Triparma verrucosa TaxID=1606542 RepID=A0A9W7F1H3_9STRA|nr:hypothetical protein TrVE_jg12685 [Triparma verrucosa]
MRSRYATSSLAFIVNHPRHLVLLRRRLTSEPIPSSLAQMATMDAPASDRNKGPILEQLQQNNLFVDDSSSPVTTLEIAAGAGVHSVYLTEELKSAGFNLSSWLPTDPDELSRASIDARVAASSNDAVRQIVKHALPLTLGPKGAKEAIWRAEPLSASTYDLIYNVNMIHISPWSATAGLMEFSGKRLNEGGALVIYGPFIVNGEMVQSNVAFDESLRAKNPAWRIRNLEDVTAKAESNGLTLTAVIDMPANNKMVVFKRAPRQEDN